MTTIYFKRINEKAIMPTKRSEDAGFDIYTTSDEVVLRPNETLLFPTGLISAFSKKYWIAIKERGSTGKIGLSVRSGVIDSGYRGEWKILLTNVNNVDIVFTNKFDKVCQDKDGTIYYPLSKAIAQAVLIPLPKARIKKWDDKKIAKSIRGETGFGASGK